MTQYNNLLLMNMKKIVIVDKRANKELVKFPKEVRLKFQAYFRQLEKDGYLQEPYSKKLEGEKELFEIRVKYKGQWRALYVYLSPKKFIVILTAFHKKSQKTQRKEILKAKNRLQSYI